MPSARCVTVIIFVVAPPDSNPTHSNHLGRSPWLPPTHPLVVRPPSFSRITLRKTSDMMLEIKRPRQSVTRCTSDQFRSRLSGSLQFEKRCLRHRGTGTGCRHGNFVRCAEAGCRRESLMCLASIQRRRTEQEHRVSFAESPQPFWLQVHIVWLMRCFDA